MLIRRMLPAGKPLYLHRRDLPGAPDLLFHARKNVVLVLRVFLAPAEGVHLRKAPEVPRGVVAARIHVRSKQTHCSYRCGGERYDGHDFVAAAFSHGAAAALVEERANLACERDAVIQRDAAGFWASSLRLSMPQSRKYLLRRYIRDKNGTCQFGGLIDGH